MSPHIVLVSLLCGVAAIAIRPAVAAPQAAALMPSSRDYTFMWWAYGWRGRSPEGRKVLCIQTGRYGLAIDTERVELLRLGAIAKPLPYGEAVAQDNQVVLGLPKAELGLAITSGGKDYRCVKCNVAAEDQLGYPMRMVESGRFVQRVYIDHLVFQDIEDQTLPVRARFEIIAWPDRVTFLLDVTPERELPNGRPEVSLTREGRPRSPAAPADTHYPVNTPWPSGIRRSASVSLAFGPQEDQSAVTVRAARGSDAAPISVAHDRVCGWHRIELPSETWTDADSIAHLERARLSLANTSSREQRVHLLFAKDYGFRGITGFTPMLRDTDGNPTGIPVQVSKNWHRTPGRPFAYEGPWFHGFSLIMLPPHSRAELDLDIAYGHWGRAPVASHAQLCLIGYGVNQLWEQAAIGSWGESICYDPDVNLNRAVIDDVRPLMVWQMGARGRKWNWTNNAGGGDFLVYHDEHNRKQFLSRMRTAYLSHGPCLTDVVYAGVTADGKIAARVEVMLPRTDDCVRVYHRFRYDVRQPVRFSRLAFYQVGADHYNDPRFDRLARGSADGLTEEWSFTKGGKRYDRAGVPLSGSEPWISLHAGTDPDPKGGGYATRGLVVRSWKARLGGKEVPTPYAAFFGTEDGNVPGMNAELAPPPGVTQLQPGDFVEAEVELLVIPMSADEYYGPNENLRAALRAGANSWQPIHRGARCGGLAVTALRGRLLSRTPVAVRASSEGACLAIQGGLGYVPVTFRGLHDYRGWQLVVTAGGRKTIVDQSVHGRDFWQAYYDAASKTWSLTYNVPLDTTADARRTVHLDLRRAR